MPNKEKKGFSGLSDLVSDVTEENTIIELSTPISKENIPPKKQDTPKSPPPLPPRKKKASKNEETFPKLYNRNRFKKLNWKWILGIIGVLFVIWLGNNEEQSSSSNRSTPRKSTYKTQPRQSTLAREIENGKTYAKQLEEQIDEMDEQLEDYKERIIFYRDSDMVDEYNSLVPTFNSLVNERNELYEEYRQTIDEINYKVNRYNSGSR